MGVFLKIIDGQKYNTKTVTKPLTICVSKCVSNEKSSYIFRSATASFSSRSGETRTPDLLTPSQARYQLRYTPESEPKIRIWSGKDKKIYA
jgi:hypothetical protein